MFPLLKQWTYRLNRLSHNVSQNDLRAPQLYLALCDSRDVKQVIHQTGEVADLTFDHRALVLKQ